MTFSTFPAKPLADSNLLRLLCHEATDGLRLLMFGPMQVDLASLRTTFEMLGHEQKLLQLHAMEFVYSHNVQLNLRSIETGSAIGKVGIHLTGLNPYVINWYQTFEEWTNCIDLLDALIDAESPSHQYFDGFTFNDIRLVISKGEYSDSLMFRG